MYAGDQATMSELFVSKPLKIAERDVILEAYVIIYSGDVRQASNPLKFVPSSVTGPMRRTLRLA